MRPLTFVLPHAIVFWAVLVWSFYPEMKITEKARVDAKKEGSKDAGSVRLLLTITFIAFLLAFPAGWVTRTAMALTYRVPIFYAGVALMILGSLLRRLCWRTLGQHFTGDVRASADQPVIETGPYRWVRHPSYTAGILMYVGIGVALTNWLSLALLFTATVVSYAYRVRVEEKALLLEIGAPYAEFSKTRKRFVPFIV